MAASRCADEPRPLRSIEPLLRPAAGQLVVSGASDAERMTALAEWLQTAAPLETSASGAGSPLELRETQAGLVLAGDQRSFGAPVQVDFLAGRTAHRQQFGGGRGQLVARACGLKRGVTPHVVDATAGLGRDAFVLAGLGCPVLMLERSAVIAALLHDALVRADRDTTLTSVMARLSLIAADAAVSLTAAVARAEFAPEVIHLDPMYPHRSGSALVKKEMRLFRTLVGDDDDSPRLLEAALATATHRVVVKRPKGAPAIAGPAPQHSLETRGTRYDLYVHRALERR
ncbi:16S rRNA (guanine1516-N2)-methyltransferase [Kushneria sinocarnis]|uniref:Ribosomal RNA small subunit methyltransferase J n=1 Tax=Kushneria sinocarnis TaxID=595502 RepID=A0A420WZJ4_9GAMM|nr:class I SAM-dependent methyltransferase [Kushneria sinocarnis]RKR06645.1 16S rRNA (guanine1516-N2)-methyltransferase [Kushneria sinocarnis]